MIRRQERVRLIYQLRVFDTGTGSLLGHMIDITHDGFLVIGESPAVPRAGYSLRMDLPRNVMQDSLLAFQAECKWCRRDPSGDFFSMGFGVSNMTGEALEIVRRLIDDFYGEDDHGKGEVQFNPPLPAE